MDVKVVTLLCLTCACSVHCLPTVYKYNENRLLEPDLIPVSSTVIPLPVYKVTYGLNVGASPKDATAKKPEGPIHLVTIHSKKKATELQKHKPSDHSNVKEVGRKDFGNES